MAAGIWRALAGDPAGDFFSSAIAGRLISRAKEWNRGAFPGKSKRVEVLPETRESERPDPLGKGEGVVAGVHELDVIEVQVVHR
jgi:hypothetical protein